VVDGGDFVDEKLGKVKVSHTRRRRRQPDVCCVVVSVLYALYSSGVTGHLVKLGLDAIGT